MISQNIIGKYVRGSVVSVDRAGFAGEDLHEDESPASHTTDKPGPEMFLQILKIRSTEFILSKWFPSKNLNGSFE